MISTILIVAVIGVLIFYLTGLLIYAIVYSLKVGNLLETSVWFVPLIVLWLLVFSVIFAYYGL